MDLPLFAHLSSGFLEPVVYLLIAACCFDVVLHIAPSRRTRLPVLVVFLTYLLFSALSFTASRNLVHVPVVAALWPQGVLFNVVHVISILFLEKIEVPTSSSLLASHNTVLSWLQFATERFKNTWRVWSNPRMIPPTHLNEPIRRRSRIIRFVAARAACLLVYYCIVKRLGPAVVEYVISHIHSSEISSRRFDLLFPPLIGKHVGRAILIRCTLALCWLTTAVSVLEGTSIVISLITVTLGLDHPEDWPPLFGCITEAVGLRCFWSRFWHRLALRSYRNWAQLITIRVLRVPPRSRVYSVAQACLIFTLSAVCHALVAWQIRDKDWFRQGEWYLLNFYGCLLETACLSAIRSTAKSWNLLTKLERIERGWCGRLLGYLWTTVFLVWSLQLTQLPQLERQVRFREGMRRFQELQAQRSIAGRLTHQSDSQ